MFCTWAEFSTFPLLDEWVHFSLGILCKMVSGRSAGGAAPVVAGWEAHRCLTFRAWWYTAIHQTSEGKEYVLLVSFHRIFAMKKSKLYNAAGAGECLGKHLGLAAEAAVRRRQTPSVLVGAVLLLPFVYWGAWLCWVCCFVVFLTMLVGERRNFIWKDLFHEEIIHPKGDIPLLP